MNPSSLYRQALELSQWVTDTVFRYRSYIYWDRVSCRFEKEFRKKHYWTWLFINFGIYGLFGLPSLALLLLRGLVKPTSVPITEMMISACLFCLGCSTFCTAVAYQKWGNDVVLSVNEIVAFEARVWRISFYLPALGAKRRRLQIRQYDLSSIWLPSGNIDWIGILVVVLVSGLSVIPLFLPWLAMWEGLDTPFLIFRSAEKSFSLIGKCIYQACRASIAFIGVAETCHCIRNVSLWFLLFVSCLRSCTRLLMKLPITQKTVRVRNQLTIIFAIVRDSVAFLFSTHLAVIYLFLVIAITQLIVNELPWHVLPFFILTIVLTFATMVILLALVVSLDISSSELRQEWIYSCSRPGIDSFKRSLLYKTLNSLQPVRFPYGSLGYFKEATRTDFFNSISINTINAVIAFR